MSGGVSRRRKRMAEGSGKLDECAVVTLLLTSAPSRLGETSSQERQVSRGSSTVGLPEDSCSTAVTVSRIALTDDPCEPRRSTKILWNQIGELREQLGVEDSVGGSIQGDEFAPPLPSNPPTPSGNALPPIGSPVGSDQTPRPENTGSTADLREEGTQGVILALMQMVANMNKDMMEERRRREEWEQRRERETGDTKLGGYEVRKARTSSGTKFVRYEARDVGLNEVLR
ncbi:hypothetical protein TREMEDRAFT_59955 [Tremella mesenterica DSM 1558]|uniref:uncharacterized protein n=1 Tax=Tremella mesenterica (strain ATCC 24925 / CBS 8224 / DSM 1558 / NBRC 9311 / NRRL Y-6157 / RJB 2259-6 / UBC 559-6) TaxID=578456 RepID=UPI0003F4A03B|nr:uncharacterized protein TREMEDRAFT_59955 [Tremella mesenterica DSM 1558]EIW71010.1 hypothetical protein TREMEDRAFT_59955 [Tremella mesenterica DSM 1558]